MVDLPGGDGANDGYWRFQIRDRLGQWVKMGGSVMFDTIHPNYGPISGTGIFVGGSRPEHALIKLNGHPKLGDITIEVPAIDMEAIKAIIPADAPGLAKAKELDALDGKIINAPTASKDKGFYIEDPQDGVLREVTFEHEQKEVPGFTGEQIIVTAFYGERRIPIAQMQLTPESGMVKNIEVDAAYQRKGVATELWKYAQVQGLSPKHSPTQTPDGEKWAESLDKKLVSPVSTLTSQLKDSITGDEVLQKIYASMGKLAKSDGRFAVGRSNKDVRAAAKETYKTVYEKLKIEYPDLAEAYPDYESYWARASNGLAAGWTTRWADSVDEIDALTKASNRIYAREILGLKEDGLIEFYRNAVNHMKDEDLAASGYASLDRRMAWDYNSYISQYADNGLNSTDGRYIVRARPDEVTGLIGFSQVEDEYGVVIGTDVVSQDGRKERVGDLEVQTIAPWSSDFKEFDRSGGGSPFRRVSPASQFEVFATETPVPGDEYSDFYKVLGLDPKERAIPTKWDEMFGEGSFEALNNKYPSYRTIQSYFVDAGDGKVGLDMLALDRVSSRNSADPKAGDEYDTHLKMLSVIQELSGKTFMVHRGHKKDDPRIPESEPVIETAVAEKPDAVTSPEIAKATEPWKDIEPGVQDRGGFTLEKNVYGMAVDFTGLESPVTAVDPEMISEDHAAALKRYTSNGYRFINTYLRFSSEFEDSDKADTKDIKATISAMDEMIEENGEVFEASRVFRGQILYNPLKSGDTDWVDVMENLEVGDVISDPGYMSTSNDPLVSFRDFGPGSGFTTWLDDDSVWSKNAVGQGAVFWMIDVPEGSKAFALPNQMGQGQGAEREVILPRNSQLRVKGIRRVAQQSDFYDSDSTNGQYNYYVETELVPQDTPGVIDVVDKTAEERGAVDVKSLSSIADLVSEYEDLTSRIEALDDPSKSKAEKGNIAMRALLEMMGKNNKPELVNSLEDLSGSPIYRGAGKLSLESMKNSDSDRIGVGYTGDGYYFSDVKATATDYAGMQEYEADPGEVITASWKTDAKVYNFESIKKLQKEAANRSAEAYDELQNRNLDSEAHDEVYVALFISSYESLVSSLILEGYDGMTIFNSEDDETYTVVFNRGALQIVNN